MKKNGRTKQHAGSKKLVAILLAIPITLALTTVAFASTSGQTPPLGISNATKRSAMWQPREVSTTNTTRDRPLTRMREAVQNRMESSDFEELRMAKQDLMESGDMERFKEDLETLKGLREQSKDLWTTIDGLNQEIKPQAEASRKALQESLMALPINDRAAVVETYLDTITQKHEAVEAVRVSIRKKEILKTTSWLAFKQALLETNFEKAEAELDEILILKTDIIDLQGNLVAAKQDLLNALAS